MFIPGKGWAVCLTYSDLDMIAGFQIKQVVWNEDWQI